MFGWLFSNEKSDKKRCKQNLSKEELFIKLLEEYFEIDYVEEIGKHDPNKKLLVAKGNNKVLSQDQLLSFLRESELYDYFEVDIADRYRCIDVDKYNKVLHLLNYKQYTGKALCSEVFIALYIPKEVTYTYNRSSSDIDNYTEFLVGYIKRGFKPTSVDKCFTLDGLNKIGWDRVITLPTNARNIEVYLNKFKDRNDKNHIYTSINIFDTDTLFELGDAFSIYGFIIPKGYICPPGFLESCQGQPFSVYNCNDYTVYGEQYVPLFKDIKLPKKGIKL